MSVERMLDMAAQKLYVLENENDRMKDSLRRIDEIGNGLEKGGDPLTAYADLMRCGAIARKALNEG